MKKRTPAILLVLHRRSLSLSTSDLMWANSQTIHTASHLNKQYVGCVLFTYIHPQPLTTLRRMHKPCFFLPGDYHKVIPARGSSIIHVSFTPLTLSGSVCESRCEGLALGFMSLDSEVTKNEVVIPEKANGRYISFTLNVFNNVSCLFTDGCLCPRKS